MKLLIRHWLPGMFILSMFLTHSQETDIAAQGNYYKHRLSLGLGHTHVPAGELADGRDKIAFASWTLDYDYHFNERWAVGIQTDLIMESFIIMRQEDEEIERDFPFSVASVALFKPFERWSFVGGLGAEFAPGETLAFTRLGAEYGFEISEKWEIGVSLLWDAKWDYYNSWGLAFMISRLW